MTTLLECSDLGFSIGRANLVAGVSLAVEEGEILAVVGANGAGKSTLLRLLSGDLSPTTGSIRIAGRPLSGCRPRELGRLRAVLPQRSTIEFAFTVRDVVLMGRSPHHESRAFRRDRVDALEADNAVVEDCLVRTGVAHLAQRAYPSLSGGEQARACFARVLAQRTPVLLLDEPTAALDIRFQHMVLGEAKRLAAQGAAVIVVLHDLNLAAAYASRIAIMHGGRMAALGQPTEVLTSETLSRVYDHPVDVIREATSGHILVVPRPVAHVGS